jgi:hypothetical protein
MERFLRRYLDPIEVVHHKNGNTLDNRLCNLELFDSNGEHLSETLAGKCPKWSEEGLEKLRAPKYSGLPTINSQNRRKNVNRDLGGILFDEEFLDYLHTKGRIKYPDLISAQD